MFRILQEPDLGIMVFGLYMSAIIALPFVEAILRKRGRLYLLNDILPFALATAFFMWKPVTHLSHELNVYMAFAAGAALVLSTRVGMGFTELSEQVAELREKLKLMEARAQAQSSQLPAGPSI
jgi:hypothetical protein